MDSMSGIVTHPGRLQPYTVWWHGYVELFTDDLGQARAEFARLTALAKLGTPVKHSK